MMKPRLMIHVKEQWEQWEPNTRFVANTLPPSRHKIVSRTRPVSLVLAELQKVAER